MQVSRLPWLLGLSIPLFTSSQEGPDLELLVDSSSWGSDKASVRTGVGALRRGGDTGVEPAFDASGAGASAASAAVLGPQLIVDAADSPPPSPAAASPSSAPLTAAAARFARVRFGVLPDLVEGFDLVDFEQRLADMLQV